MYVNEKGEDILASTMLRTKNPGCLSLSSHFACTSRKRLNQPTFPFYQFKILGTLECTCRVLQLLPRIVFSSCCRKKMPHFLLTSNKYIFCFYLCFLSLFYFIAFVRSLRLSIFDMGKTSSEMEI